MIRRNLHQDPLWLGGSSTLEQLGLKGLADSACLIFEAENSLQKNWTLSIGEQYIGYCSAFAENGIY